MDICTVHVANTLSSRATCSSCSSCRELRALPARSIRSSMGPWRIAAVQFTDGSGSALIVVSSYMSVEEYYGRSLAGTWSNAPAVCNWMYVVLGTRTHFLSSPLLSSNFPALSAGAPFSSHTPSLELEPHSHSRSPRYVAPTHTLTLTHSLTHSRCPISVCVGPRAHHQNQKLNSALLLLLPSFSFLFCPPNRNAAHPQSGYILRKMQNKI